jgi:hypothetical protein
VGLERGPLSLVSTTEELLDRKSSGSCLENREYDRGDPSRWPRDTLYRQKLAITSPTSGGRSVGIVRSRTQTMELVFWRLILTNIFPSSRNLPYRTPCTEIWTDCVIIDLYIQFIYTPKAALTYTENVLFAPHSAKSFLRE